MSKANICDLCKMDGECVLAIARYWDETGKEWQVCAKHLAMVKKAGLEYEIYEEDGWMN